MKKLALKVLSMAGLFAMLAVVPALGGPRNHKIEADIPFDFMVRDTTFPAGTYTVTQVTPGVLLVRSLDRRDSTMVATTSVETEGELQDQATLVFNRYADQYFLTQVWEGGYADGNKLVKSHEEREVAKAWELEGAHSQHMEMDHS